MSNNNRAWTKIHPAKTVNAHYWDEAGNRVNVKLQMPACKLTLYFRTMPTLQ